MKKTDFLNKLDEALNTYDVDISLLRGWYKEILDKLNISREIALKIKHPRHKGDHAEDEFLKLLVSIIPQRYAIAKGYIINEISAVSKEQDLIIYDTSVGAPLYGTEKIQHIPAEAALASIEIKSNLTLSKLRESVVNCVSAKKLLYQGFDFEESENRRHLYCIFAYSSTSNKANFIKELNSITDDIPETLRPNLIFVLNRGLYLPTTNGAIQITLSEIQKCNEPYGLFENQERHNLSVQIFLLYLGLIIEHCFHQSKHRDKPKYIQYVVRPVIWEQELEVNSKISTKKMKQIVNRNKIHQTPTGELYILDYAGKCSNCGKEYHFYAPPVASKKKLERMASSFGKKGILRLPKNMVHECDCGGKIKIFEQ